MPNWIILLQLDKVRSTELAGNILIFSKKLLSFNIEQGQKNPAAENVIVVERTIY
jgi:hypothetical protein